MAERPYRPGYGHVARYAGEHPLTLVAMAGTLGHLSPRSPGRAVRGPVTQTIGDAMVYRA